MNLCDKIYTSVQPLAGSYSDLNMGHFGEVKKLISPVIPQIHFQAKMHLLFK
jgi:hypothetical protein